ncbi:YHS domain-containing protein [Flagellimonas taeanensis]|uniref:YHS domain-containing protein n=1 Tax=Flagellimonas taeanensis TaxID=1005926 RepID=A0A1M6TXP7_9FLAO|nr:YHS domain-containing (seleno)protein [Allomuricauda taeanensis]SFB91142.1 YHS domain-containing protein [Allomuricauda taeanensis]SHK61681.1 YHS domain-containing protein [Allomuricauda taeanensis]
MKKALLALFLAIGFFAHAQSIDYNVHKGYAANGYDVVSYFSGKAHEGFKVYTTEYDGVKYKFESQSNMEKFMAEPTRYLPEYGGYCAYAVAVSGKKVRVDPETFEIRQGKLYLFYNAGNTNTLDLWLKESPNVLKTKADENWKKIKNP